MRNMEELVRLSGKTRILIILALAITFLTALVPLWKLGSDSEQVHLLRLAEVEAEEAREDAAIRVAVL